MQARLMAIAAALVCTAALGFAQSTGKDEKKKGGTTVSGTAKATGTAVKDATKTTKKGAKKTGSTAKKLGAGIKNTVTGDDNDKKK